MIKYFHNRTNITAKCDFNFLEEEILEFFRAPMGKHTLVYRRRKFKPRRKFVCDREILEIYLNSASKNTLETDIFPYGT